MRLHKSDKIEILYTIRLVEFALGLLKKHAKDASFTYTKAYTNNFKSLVLKSECLLKKDSRIRNIHT